MLLRKDIALVVSILFVFQIQTSYSLINRGRFPEGFVFGTASSAFQDSRLFLLWPILRRDD
ncbi:hypothetical protein Pint_23521 [Pistacia integerrima]|uniref:Uncharacterized protein n=1 Tax=Pistacia integerrima TaxID=434235 RepID=A0ACC0YLX8_9ROSI|nr:hypothetical protein Pint_23521 [Pistacia integerrima]